MLCCVVGVDDVCGGGVCVVFCDIDCCGWECVVVCGVDVVEGWVYGARGRGAGARDVGVG